MDVSPKLKMILNATAATAVLAAAIVAIPAAQADITMSTTGGGSCKGSSGFGAEYFYFANTYAQNTTGTPQYLTCHIPYANAVSATEPDNIQVLLLNPTAGAVQFTCALQSGYDLLPGGGTINTAIFVINVPANEEGNMWAKADSVPVIPTVPSQFAPYTLSCQMPPQTKLGLIYTRLNDSFATPI